MKLNSLFRPKMPALLAAMLATACSHTYRLGQSGLTELPWAVRSELPREETVVHIIDIDGMEHLVRSAAMSADTLYFAHHLKSFPTPQLDVDPLADEFLNGVTGGERGAIPVSDIARIRFRSRRKGFGMMFAAGAIVGATPIVLTEFETALVTIPVAGVMAAAFFPARSLVTIEMQPEAAPPPPIPDLPR